MACLPGGEIVESSQGEINFNAPDNLPFDFKFCEINIRNPEDANEIVLIDFYNIFDIRTKQDCSFYVEVYSIAVGITVFMHISIVENIYEIQGNSELMKYTFE